MKENRIGIVGRTIAAGFITAGSLFAVAKFDEAINPNRQHPRDIQGVLDSTTSVSDRGHFISDTVELNPTIILLLAGIVGASAYTTNRVTRRKK